jgi:AraC-like DNA-binding protein
MGYPSWLQITHATAYPLHIQAPHVEKRIVPAISVVHVAHGILEVRSDEETVTATPGETVLCRPGIMYHLAPRREGEDQTDTVVCQCAEIMFLLDGEADPDALLVMPDKIGPSRGAALAASVRELIETSRFSGSHLLERLARKTELANAILRHIFRESELCTESPDIMREPTLLQRIVAFCKTRLADGVTVDDMVAEAHVSRSAFYEYTKKEAGQSPAELLKRIRLERSLEFLRLPDRSIAQVADRVGFANQYHFSREFKKQFGMTPSRYRTTHRLSDERQEATSKADALFERMDYEGAAREYAEVKNRYPGPSIVLDACYRQGLSLYLAGDVDSAFEVWRGVKGTDFEPRTDLRRCRFLFDRSRHDEATELLGRLCTSVTSAVRSEALHLWSGFVEELIARSNVRPLRRYLELRGRRFPHEGDTAHAAARGLMATGRFLEVPDVCAGDDILKYVALRLGGKPEQILDRYGDTAPDNQLARTLTVMGRYEDVLERFGDNARYCVEALTCLGRADEAIERYPDDCGQALLETGAFEEVLRRFPDDDDLCAQALWMLGREDEALDRCGDSAWQRQSMLLRLGRSREVLDAGLEGETALRELATCIEGIRLLALGRDAEGRATLDELPDVLSDEYRWGHSEYQTHLVAPLALSFPGGTDVLERRLRRYVERLRYCFSQKLWYDARYLLGEIDDEQYLEQPNRHHVLGRLSFARAMRADCGGDRDKAAGLYRTYLQQTPLVADRLSCQHFARWRAG